MVKTRTACWSDVSQPTSWRISRVAPCSSASACSIRSKVSTRSENVNGTLIHSNISGAWPYARSRSASSSLLVRRRRPMRGRRRNAPRFLAPMPVSHSPYAAAEGSSSHGSRSSMRSRDFIVSVRRRSTAPLRRKLLASSHAPCAVGAAPRRAVKPSAAILRAMSPLMACGPLNKRRLALTSIRMEKSS